ncbi:MAG: general stress protein [Beijerinckiaceae bacterium]|nr:general stress protein [Beijerinckiaceae bacterium]
MPPTNDGRSRQGFASMDPERRREMARKGGSSVPSEKRAFSTDRSLAALAGKKGGAAIAKDQRAFSKDRTLASEAGSKGAATTRIRRATLPTA